MRQCSRRFLWLAFALAPAVAPALAAATQPPAEESGAAAGFLKPIAAAQSYLDRNGITLGGYLQLDASHVVSGGQPRPLGLDLQDLIDAHATVDTQKLLGWSGGMLFFDVQSHSGPNIVREQVPALADPDNMDADAGTSLDRAWYGQDLTGGKIHVQVGLMYVDDQFFTVPYGASFVSLDFSSDASISTFVLPTYPKGSWGGDVFFHPTSHWSFSAGVFRDHETELAYDPGGALLLSEEAWQGTWRGLPYALQLGAWLDTGRFQRFGGGERSNAHGVYVVASDKLWQPDAAADRGIGLFVQLGSAPPDVAPVPRHFGAGLVWTGPLASRPHDEIGLAYSDSRLTQEADFSASFESEIEAYYQLEVLHGLTIQPDVEYWQHPGGSSTPDTVLALVRFMYTF
ncbi:MAG: carbohydrate porin [Steroidobacteraceae bacterium]